MKRHILNVRAGSDSNECELNCFHRFAHDARMAIGEEVDCVRCDSLEFPPNLVAYKRTKTFNQDTVPKGFQNAHATKDKTWGKIVVLNGELDYIVDDLNDLKFELRPGVDGIIAPNMLHRVRPVGPVEFYVDFYSVADE